MKKFILCTVSSEELNSLFLDELKTSLFKWGAVFEKTEVLCEEGLKALDLYLLLPEDNEKIKFELMKISETYQADLALIPHEGREADFKLIVFDMDSTLIQQEVIDEMAQVHGVGERVKKITERAMKGELNFNEALTERVSLLKGLKKSSMEEILSRLILNPGVEKLLVEVKKKGYKTAILSGGFKYFTDHFKEELKMDYAYSNDLEFEGETLTGKLKGAIVNAETKAQLIQELSLKENLTLDQIVAVGDGANDLLMLSKAGFGIAFHAKEKVRQMAKHRLSHGPMSTLLYFLGFPGNHWDNEKDSP